MTYTTPFELILSIYSKRSNGNQYDNAELGRPVFKFEEVFCIWYQRVRYPDVLLVRVGDTQRVLVWVQDDQKLSYIESQSTRASTPRYTDELVSTSRQSVTNGRTLQTQRSHPRAIYGFCPCRTQAKPLCSTLIGKMYSILVHWSIADCQQSTKLSSVFKLVPNYGSGGRSEMAGRH